jgi:exosortase
VLSKLSTVATIQPSPVRDASPPPARFARWWQAATIGALAAVLYGEVLYGLALDWWTQPHLSYGLLIPPLTVYLTWLQRDAILSVPARPDNRGLALVGISCLLYAVGKLGAEFFLARSGFVLLLAGLTWTFWGIARLRSMSLPFLLLATMIPLPVIVYNSVAAPLQLFASEIATMLAQACGVSVFRDGNILALASISLGVEEACSGLNSLSALIVASVLSGFLFLRRTPSRWMLFLASIPIAIGVNVVRVAATAILADYNEKFAMGFYHSFSGWLVFVVAFGAQCGVAALLRGGLERARA